MLRDHTSYEREQGCKKKQDYRHLVLVTPLQCFLLFVHAFLHAIQSDGNGWFAVALIKVLVVLVGPNFYLAQAIKEIPLVLLSLIHFSPMAVEMRRTLWGSAITAASVFAQLSIESNTSFGSTTSREHRQNGCALGENNPSANS